MRLSLSTSTFALVLLSCSVLAAPASNLQRGFLDDIKNAAHDLQNATLKGVVNTLKQSIENPALTECEFNKSDSRGHTNLTCRRSARLEVVKGISQTTVRSHVVP